MGPKYFQSPLFKIIFMTSQFLKVKVQLLDAYKFIYLKFELFDNIPRSFNQKSMFFATVTQATLFLFFFVALQLIIQTNKFT